MHYGCMRVPDVILFLLLVLFTLPLHSAVFWSCSLGFLFINDTTGKVTRGRNIWGSFVSFSHLLVCLLLSMFQTLFHSYAMEWSVNVWSRKRKPLQPEKSRKKQKKKQNHSLFFTTLSVLIAFVFSCSIINAPHLLTMTRTRHLLTHICTHHALLKPLLDLFVLLFFSPQNPPSVFENKN